MRGQDGHFVALHAGRGVCAVLVMLFHLPLLTHLGYSEIVRHSWLCVDFFFVLSGFVIASVYMDRLRTAFDLRDFMLRRFARVWPLHAFVLLVLIAYIAFQTITRPAGLPSLFAAGGTTPAAAIPSQLLMVQSMGLGQGDSWNAPAWSVSVEFWTYILFGLVCCWLPRRSGLVFAALAIVAAAVVWRFSSAFLATYEYLAVFRCIYGFATGVLVFQLWRRTRSFAGRASGHLELPVLAAVLAYIYLVDATAASMAAPLVFALAVYVFAAAAGPVSAVLGAPALRRLGDLSYAIYMTHYALFTIAMRFVHAYGRHGGEVTEVKLVFSGIEHGLARVDSIWLGDLLALGLVALVLACSWLSFAWLEMPARRQIQRLARRRPLEAPLAGVPASEGLASP